LKTTFLRFAHLRDISRHLAGEVVSNADYSGH